MRIAKLMAIPLVALAVGCTADTSDLKTLSIAEVATLRDKSAAVIVDANGKDTRDKYGVIPGAVLLSSSSEYALSELPAKKDSSLVFYCGGVMCSAAPKAARRAVEAGYTDVHVFPEGISGWVEAGKPVDKPAKG
jgi:rhodanese-related sulfurtransferase